MTENLHLDYDAFLRSISKELQRLLHIAKTANEFEFVNVLLGFNGMGDQRALTHLHESRSYIEDMKERYANEQNLHSKVRLGLHLYCHIFEMNELYSILGNLTRIASSQKLRYIPDLYTQTEPHLTPSDKLARISDMAPYSHMQPLLNLIYEMYKNDLRNSFAHSSYSLFGENYHIIKGKGVKFGNDIRNTLSIKDHIIPLVHNTLGFITEFFKLIDDHKKSYIENKMVTAHMPEEQSVLILGDRKKGLIGFHTSVGSWIKLNSQNESGHYIEAMNISINISSEGSPLQKELEQYVEKLTPFGKAFNEIRDKVIQSSESDLLRILSLIYYNWANDTVKTAENKPIRQSDAILLSAIERYDLSITTDPTFDRAYLNKATTLLIQHKSKGTLTTQIRKDLLGLYNKSLKLNPVSFESLLNSSQILQELGNEEEDQNQQILYFNESEQRSLKALDLNPHEGKLYKNLGWLKTRLGNLNIDAPQNFGDAISYYEKTLNIESNLENELVLASSLEDLAGIQNKQEAVESIKRSISILLEVFKKYGLNSDISYRLGNKYAALSKIENETDYLKDAIKNFEKAIELDATNLKAINNLCHCQLLLYVNEGGGSESRTLLHSIKERLEDIVVLESHDIGALYNIFYADLELAKISDPENRSILVGKSIERMNEIEKLDGKPNNFDMSRAYAIIEDIDNSLQHLKLWLSEGNNWENAGFKEDFRILFENVEFLTMAKEVKE